MAEGPFWADINSLFDHVIGRASKDWGTDKPSAFAVFGAPAELDRHRTAATYPVEGVTGDADVRFGSKADNLRRD